MKIKLINLLKKLFPYGYIDNLYYEERLQLWVSKKYIEYNLECKKLSIKYYENILFILKLLLNYYNTKFNFLSKSYKYEKLKKKYSKILGCEKSCSKNNDEVINIKF